MKFYLFLSLLLPCVVEGFVLPTGTQQQGISLSATTNDDVASTNPSRREILQSTLAGVVSGATAMVTLSSTPVLAEETSESTATAPAIKKVVVTGATGQTGSRVFDRLKAQNFVATGGVRNVAKASKSLSGNLQQIDVVADSLESITASLEGAEGLIIASGMNPGKNLLRMSAAAHEVDNLGTIKLIDAAKKAGVKKIVMVSSILTDGRSWGQEQSPGFIATNAFGGALDEKLVAEKYLRASGVEYTILRPGGLKLKPPTGELSINAENTLNSGEISRDLVADVCVAALNDANTSNKVLEIIENDDKPPKAFNGLVM